MAAEYRMKVTKSGHFAALPDLAGRSFPTLPFGAVVDSGIIRNLGDFA